MSISGSGGIEGAFTEFYEAFELNESKGSRLRHVMEAQNSVNDIVNSRKDVKDLAQKLKPILDCVWDARNAIKRSKSLNEEQFKAINNLKVQVDEIIKKKGTASQNLSLNWIQEEFGKVLDKLPKVSKSRLAQEQQAKPTATKQAEQRVEPMVTSVVAQQDRELVKQVAEQIKPKPTAVTESSSQQTKVSFQRPKAVERKKDAPSKKQFVPLQEKPSQPVSSPSTPTVLQKPAPSQEKAASAEKQSLSEITSELRKVENVYQRIDQPKYAFLKDTLSQYKSNLGIIQARLNLRDTKIRDVGTARSLDDVKKDQPEAFAAVLFDKPEFVQALFAKKPKECDEVETL